MATKRPTRPRDVDPVDGYVSAASSPYLGSGLMVEAVALFVDEAFGRSQLRKVYMLLSERSRRAAASTLLDVLDVLASCGATSCSSVSDRTSPLSR